MPCQIVPNQDHTHGWISIIRYFLAPLPPKRQEWRRAQRFGARGQGDQYLLYFLLQPRMEHRVGRTFDPACPYLAGGRTEARQQFGGAAPEILMGLPCGLALRRPPTPRLWDGLIGTGFILAPDRDA
jgi:hypothetical protein